MNKPVHPPTAIANIHLISKHETINKAPRAALTSMQAPLTIKSSPKSRRIGSQHYNEPVARGPLPPPKQTGQSSSRTEFGHFKSNQLSRSDARDFKRNWIQEERQKNQHLSEVQMLLKSRSKSTTDRRVATADRRVTDRESR